MKQHKRNCFKVRWAFFFLFFLHGTSIGNGQQGISYNGLQLGVRFLAYRMFQVYHNANSQKLTLSCCYNQCHCLTIK